MSEVTIKFLVVEVDGEAVLKYPFPIFQDGDNLEMMEAILSSNPVLRIVESVEIGDTWDGQNFISPVE
jgi:hypothetical protein